MNRHRSMLRAKALLRGDSANPNLRGIVTFKQTSAGVLVTAEVYGLPHRGESHPGIFALHIHEGESCGSEGGEPFSLSGGHYNPSGSPHPFHAGDLPPLFANRGHAYLSVVTDRFAVSEIIGRTVIIHSDPDDFTSQPSGNAGTKIACGIIFAI